MLEKCTNDQICTSKMYQSLQHSSYHIESMINASVRGDFSFNVTVYIHFPNWSPQKQIGSNHGTTGEHQINVSMTRRLSMKEHEIPGGERRGATAAPLSRQNELWGTVGVKQAWRTAVMEIPTQQMKLLLKNSHQHQEKILQSEFWKHNNKVIKAHRKIRKKPEKHISVLLVQPRFILTG